MYLRLLDSTSFISAKQHVCRIVNVWDECDVLIKHNPSRWTHPGINALSTSRTFTRGVKLGSLRGEANTAWIGIFWLTTDLMKYVFLVRTNTTTYSFSLSPSVSIDRLQSELHLHKRSNKLHRNSRKLFVVFHNQCKNNNDNKDIWEVFFSAHKEINKLEAAEFSVQSHTRTSPLFGNVSNSSARDYDWSTQNASCENCSFCLY